MSIDTDEEFDNDVTEMCRLNCLSALMSIDTLVAVRKELKRCQSQLPFGVDVD